MSANETLPPTHRTLRKVAGACGILAIIIALSSIALAIFYAPVKFSIMQNWFSDLGGINYTEFAAFPRPEVASPTTELFFNTGLAVAGVLGIVFALGLLSDAHSPAYRLGAVCMIPGAAALAGVGLLPEPLGAVHDIVTAAFVIFSVAAMFVIGGSLVASSVKPLGGFSIVLGIVALAGLFDHITLIFHGRAFAESIFIGAIALWIMVFSIRMLRRVALRE